LKKLYIFELLHSKRIHPSACSHKAQSFLPNHAPKTPESQQLFFGLQLVSIIFQHPAIQTKNVRPFGGFFQQKKCASQRKDSIQTVIRTSRRLDSFSGKPFRTFQSFQKFKTEIKNQKSIAVDVLFKAYPMVQLSGPSTL
jgi:hypothetical protein